MDHLGTADAEDDSGSLTRLAPSPHSEAVAHEFKELSLQSNQYLPPLNEQKNENYLKNLKHVLEMKNQQIDWQEKMIMELETNAKKIRKLVEEITMPQQQNEELGARIELNTVIIRQLSEENANLQEYIEKEMKEMKQLSRTNQELLWKLQEGDAMSPVKISSTLSASLYSCSSGNAFPAKVRTLRQ